MSSMCKPSDHNRIGPNMALKIPVALPPMPIQPVAFSRAIEEQRAARPAARNRREFLLFIKILLKCIEKSKNYKLSIQAKALVAESIKRNRMGDPHFSPLQENLEMRLRGLVGPMMFQQAKDCMEHFRAAKMQRAIAQQQQQQQQQQQLLQFQPQQQQQQLIRMPMPMEPPPARAAAIRRH